MADTLKVYPVTRSVRVSLWKRLCGMNLSEHGDLEHHFRKIDDLVNQLDAAGTVIDKDIRICMVLRSLPPSFDGIVRTLDNRANDDISLDIVKSKIMDEYLRQLERESIGSKVEQVLRSVESKRRESRECYFCKRPGHLRRECRKYKKFLKEERSRAEKERSKAQVGSSEGRHVAFTSVEHVQSSAWLIDSGAVAHMTNDRAVFGWMKNTGDKWITTADGRKSEILGEGSAVLLGLDDKDELVRIEVKDLKYVPGMKTNVISVAKLAEKRLKVDFKGEGCRIVDPGGAVVATGRRCAGRYYLRTAEEATKALTGEDSVHHQHQWHRRIGHRDWSAGKRVVKEGSTGIKVSDCGERLGRDCCMEGGSVRLPFPSVERNRMNQERSKDEKTQELRARIEDLASRLSQQAKEIKELSAAVLELKDLFRKQEVSARSTEDYRF